MKALHLELLYCIVHTFSYFRLIEELNTTKIYIFRFIYAMTMSYMISMKSRLQVLPPKHIQSSKIDTTTTQLRTPHVQAVNGELYRKMHDSNDD